MNKTLAQLESLLGELLAEHEQLEAMIVSQREAMRSADHTRIAACCRLANEHVQRIGEMEKQRLSLVGEITEAWSSTAKIPLSVVEIAERIGGDRGGRLLAQRGKLREAMERVKRESAIARRAADGLLSHVKGLIGAAAAAIGEAGVYGRRGLVTVPCGAASTFSITG